MPNRRSKSKGFTLIEMLPVIVLLSITAMGAISLLKTSSQIFIDVSNRDEFISSVRFSVERLNREVRNALPNSVRVYNLLEGNRVDDLGQEDIVKCLEYIPTIVGTVYLDVPVIPDFADSELTVISFDDTLLEGEVHVVVNPLAVDHVYDIIADPVAGVTGSTSTRRYQLDLASGVGKIIDNLWTVNLVNKVHFAENAPTKRLYFVNPPVAYCASAGQLIRYAGYGFTGVPFNDNNEPLVNNNGESLSGTGVLMAEGIEAASTAFSVTEPSSFTNTLIDVTLKFTKNDETLTFFNQVQVLNVP